MTRTVLRARDLRYWYRGGRGLPAFSVDLAPGETLAVLGPSGSGKSTLLAVLGLILTPAAGTLRLLGHDVMGVGAAVADRLRREHIGILLQDPGLLPYLSACENVAFALGPRLDQHRSEAVAALEEVGVAGLADRPVTQMSGGERQRVAVARAAVRRPSLLLADEPTGSLDAENREAVVSLLTGQAHRGTALVVATHDPIVAAAADRRIVLTTAGAAS